MNTLNKGLEFEFAGEKGKSSIIKVIGVGGGGNNALKHMYEKGIKGVDFIICNTDAQALDENPVSNKVQLGIKETEGLGAGADPEVGKRAAQESIDEIKEMLGTNTKMVFITAGMGGGTGTGAAPVIAKTAKDMGILTVGIVTVPFSFEGPRRLRQAEEGLEELRESVDSLIVINNDKLRQQFGNLGFKSGFAKADEILSSAAKGMAEVITGYFIVNIDFRDAKTVLQNSGTALMSEGIASGDNKAEEAVRKALDSPLLNDNKITGAKDVLLLIRSGNQEVTMDEVGLINDHIQREAGNTADIIWGIGEDESLEDNISVLVIATGFAPENKKNVGIPDTIKIPLNEKTKVTTVETSMVGASATVVGSVPKPTATSSEADIKKEVFVLKDTDDVKPFTPQNIYTATEFQQVELVTETIVEEEPKGEFNVFERENNQASISFEEEKEEKKSFDLFSYNDLEPVSYTFDLSDELKEEKSFSAFDSIEEPVVDFSVREEPTVESNEIEEIEDSSAFKMFVGESAEVNIQEESFVSFEEIPVRIEQKEEFTIIEKQKTEESAKVQERRNKLKEFNFRYQEEKEDDTFETVPAFKRRNLEMDLENASEQRVTRFYTEEEGRAKLRENKFLNKDVD